MGKSYFLNHFQRNLRDDIEDLICYEWGYSDLIVKEEDGDMPGQFSGYMDISISNPKKENTVVGIEIEHISDYYQARKNINKLKTWTHNSVMRTSSLLHIFNENCNISYDNIGLLVRFAKNNEHKNCGFYYDYIFYNADDLKQTKQKALDLTLSIEFKTRLWMLIEDSGII